MKKAILIHNPTAGSADHEKEDLKERISEAGYEVIYYSTQNPLWEHFTHKEGDIIFVAGGDGTVQKVAAAMLETGKDEVFQIPIRVIPHGTANNIANTLNIKNPGKKFETTYNGDQMDIGRVKGIGEVSFFIEGMGCGIFPRLLEVMGEKDEEEKQDEITQSLKELLKIIKSYQAQEAIIIADKEEITGKFLLLELMNIRFIGPNVELAPNARTDDGYFELVCVRENAREDLSAYVESLLNGAKSPKKIEEFADLRRVSEVRLKWKGRDVHIDDEIVNYKGTELHIYNQQGVFRMIVP